MGARFIVYNNTGVRIVVVSDKKTITIKPQRTRKVYIPNSGCILVIKTYQDEWHYRVNKVPREYYYTPANAQIKSRIDKDGRFYIFPDNVKLPAIEYFQQPNGFPLMPHKKGKKSQSGMALDGVSPIIEES